MVFLYEKKDKGAKKRCVGEGGWFERWTRKFEPPTQGCTAEFTIVGTLAQQCANFDWTRTADARYSKCHNAIFILISR